MSNWRYLAPIALGLTLLAGIHIGRRSVPQSHVIETSTEERVTVLRYASTHTWSTSWHVRTASRVRRVVWLPDGTVSSEERDATEDRGGTQESTQTVAQEAQQRERIELWRDERTAPVEPPRWMLGAQVAPSLTGIDGAAVTGGVRVVGPLWATGTVQRVRGEWTGLVGVGVTW